MGCRFSVIKTSPRAVAGDENHPAPRLAGIFLTIILALTALALIRPLP